MRAGTYGVRSRRQRYLCRPVDAKAHQFTPALSREAVSPGDSCARCDELLSPHHGSLTAARHTPWPLLAVTQALNDLSLGASYADVSLAMRAHRDAASEHLHDAHGITAFTRSAASAATSTTSYSNEERKNAWRVAADLVEQYSPLLFADVEARYRTQAQALRDANDAALAADPTAGLVQPLVYVLDELPIWTDSGPGKAKRPSWFVLTVVEVDWKVPDDPFLLPKRGDHLRLARAFPRSNSDAWQLVLDELGVRPDFVVADNGSGLQLALKEYYGSQVGIVPSIWHIHQNLRDTLTKLDNATYLDGKEKVLVDSLAKHLAQLARIDLVGSTANDIHTWWDSLIAIVEGLPAPVSAVKNERTIHEQRLIDALPILTANPHVPASNAQVELVIRNDLKPFLENRAHRFGNAERTNRLLNLLVCRGAGVFTNLDELGSRIRQLNEATNGWAPKPRVIVDRQPPATGASTKRYASLKSRNVIVKLAKTKGITTTAQALAAAPPPVLSKQKASTAAQVPIREWARALGLPAGVTGPIRESVRTAYQAAQDGATDEEAKTIYREAEAARLDAINVNKKAKWSGGAERRRRDELAPIRAWAKAQNIDLPRNAVIPPEVTAAYEAHLAGKPHNVRPSKQPRKAKP